MRRQFMSKNKTKLMLGLPYYFWSAAFVILPLFMVVYYGITDKNGALTFNNIASIAKPEHIKSLLLAI